MNAKCFMTKWERREQKLQKHHVKYRLWSGRYKMYLIQKVLWEKASENSK